MSMTKNYLFSLSKEQQDAILGAEEAGIDADYEAAWASREAENEPTEEDLWWARMLMEGDEEDQC